VLKAALAAILAANLLFFGYTRGWFDGVFGLNARGDREPERLASQVRPASIVLMPMAPASSASAVAAACLEAGPIAAGDAGAAEAILKAVLPAGAWVDVRNEATHGNAAVVVTHTYRVANADATIAARLAALKLDASGRGFSACARTEPAR
jgi:hypothetical protein